MASPVCLDAVFKHVPPPYPREIPSKPNSLMSVSGSLSSSDVRLAVWFQCARLCGSSVAAGQWSENGNWVWCFERRTSPVCPTHLSWRRRSAEGQSESSWACCSFSFKVSVVLLVADHGSIVSLAAQLASGKKVTTVHAMQGETNEVLKTVQYPEKLQTLKTLLWSCKPLHDHDHPVGIVWLLEYQHRTLQFPPSASKRSY